MKVEAGLCEGEVLHHAYGKVVWVWLWSCLQLVSAVHKSQEEKRHLRAAKEGVRHLKEKRRRVQEMNVARKKKEREENKERSLAGMRRQEGAGSDSDGEEEKEWFRKEVGEEPDPGVHVRACVPDPGVRVHACVFIHDVHVCLLQILLGLG